MPGWNTKLSNAAYTALMETDGPDGVEGIGRRRISDDRIAVIAVLAVIAGSVDNQRPVEVDKLRVTVVFPCASTSTWLLPEGVSDCSVQLPANAITSEPRRTLRHRFR